MKENEYKKVFDKNENNLAKLLFCGKSRYVQETYQLKMKSQYRIFKELKL
jgi:hypothetical protein